MKIASIVGARPQFIKIASLCREFASKDNTKHLIIHTGQHYDYMMSKVFFDELGIPEPDYNLEVGSGKHGEQTGFITQRTEDVLLKEKPEVVLTYGDTNSTLGGAIAAAKLRIPVVHVEAGLRSFNKNMPEEINRVLTDHISSVLLCPSEIAAKNLREEGFSNIINGGKLIDYNFHVTSNNILSHSWDISHPIIINVGDVMYDILCYAIDVAENKSNIMNQLQVYKKDFYLLTLHRAENTDNQKDLKKIIDFVNKVVEDKIVLFPLHPRTRKVYDSIQSKLADNFKIIEPLGYFNMLVLLKNSLLVMTDSGGMQKEAYWLKTPCITLREETEWIETIESGWNVLYKNYQGLFHLAKSQNLVYGDGKASARIANIIYNVTNGNGEIQLLAQ